METMDNVYTTFVTLRDLRNLLSTRQVDKHENPSYTDHRFPRGWKETEKKKTPLVSYNDGRLRMAVYPDGIVIAHQGKHHAIFHIDDCGDYDYRFCKRIPGDSTPHHFDAEYFMDQRWEVRVLMEAEDRLEKRNDHYEFDHAARY